MCVFVQTVTVYYLTLKTVSTFRRKNMNVFIICGNKAIFHFGGSNQSHYPTIQLTFLILLNCGNCCCFLIQLMPYWRTVVFHDAFKLLGCTHTLKTISWFFIVKVSRFWTTEMVYCAFVGCHDVFSAQCSALFGSANVIIGQFDFWIETRQI